MRESSYFNTSSKNNVAVFWQKYLNLKWGFKPHMLQPGQSMLLRTIHTHNSDRCSICCHNCYHTWNTVCPPHNSISLRKVKTVLSLLKANQSGLYILSLIQLNVRNTHQCLPKDLIILLISNYFKDKWVHLASKQTCQWWTRETVPSSLLSLEINGPTIKPFFIYLFFFF